MKNTTYNGWTNYATWRINLEMIDTDYYRDTLEGSGLDTYDISKMLQEDIELYLEENGEGIVLDYALSFISDVNWYEIAEHIVESIGETL